LGQLSRHQFAPEFNHFDRVGEGRLAARAAGVLAGGGHHFALGILSAEKGDHITNIGVASGGLTPVPVARRI
jgi:hypothetical protein